MSAVRPGAGGAVVAVCAVAGVVALAACGFSAPSSSPSAAVAPSLAATSPAQDASITFTLLLTGSVPTDAVFRLRFHTAGVAQDLFGLCGSQPGSPAPACQAGVVYRRTFDRIPTGHAATLGFERVYADGHVEQFQTGGGILQGDRTVSATYRF
jgi:hypothetical protein